MSMCSDGDSFNIVVAWEYDGLGTMNGCFEDSGYKNNELPLYFRGGEEKDGEPLVAAVDGFGRKVIWVLAHYDQSAAQFLFRCKDSDENDASKIHPTEVVQWDCLDTDDYTLLDGVTATCGCSTTTPAPTSVPEPTPPPSATSPVVATCSDGDPFYIDTTWEYDGIGTMSGCFEDSGYFQLDLPEYFRGGEKEHGQPVVLASDEYGTNVIWTLAQYDSSSTSYDVRCKDSAEEDASQIHPTEIIQWDCFDEGTNSFSRYNVVRATCGCTNTPSPSSLGSAGGDEGSFADSPGGIILWVILTLLGGGLTLWCCNDCSCDDCCNCCNDC